jgi:hypothetical protein
VIREESGLKESGETKLEKNSAGGLLTRALAANSIPRYWHGGSRSLYDRYRGMLIRGQKRKMRSFG